MFVTQYPRLRNLRGRCFCGGQAWPYMWAKVSNSSNRSCVAGMWAFVWLSVCTRVHACAFIWVACVSVGLFVILVTEGCRKAGQGNEKWEGGEVGMKGVKIVVTDNCGDRLAHTHAQPPTQMHMCANTCVCRHTHTNTRADTHTHISYLASFPVSAARARANTRTHTHTHIHTHRSAQTRAYAFIHTSTRASRHTHTPPIWRPFQPGW